MNRLLLLVALIGLFAGSAQTAEAVGDEGKVANHADTKPTTAFEITCKEAGTLTFSGEGDKAVFTIKGGRGIGSASIKRNLERWPGEVILRVHLGGLESLAISNGKETLSASVLSHSGNRRLLHLSKDGKEGPALEKESPCWMEIRAFDAEGKPVQGLPPKGGRFEMTIPKALLADAGELVVSWVDFFR